MVGLDEISANADNIRRAPDKQAPGASCVGYIPAFSLPSSISLRRSFANQRHLFFGRLGYPASKRLNRRLDHCSSAPPASSWHLRARAGRGRRRSIGRGISNNALWLWLSILFSKILYAVTQGCVGPHEVLLCNDKHEFRCHRNHIHNINANF